MRIIPQRVAPIASAASFSPGGACENTSRTIDVMIGVIISATITPAMNARRLEVRESVWKNGMKSRCVVSHLLTPTRCGWSTVRPQSPKSRLGTAASRSMSEVSHRRAPPARTR